MSETTQTPTGRPWPRVSKLRIATPVVLILAALIAAGVSATVSESSGTGSSARVCTLAPEREVVCSRRRCPASLRCSA